MGNPSETGTAAHGAQILSPMEVDAVGEVMNICMGSAATAVSSMLDKPVSITTPEVSIAKVSQIDVGPLEPALIVKITYTEGVEGANVMVFRQRDMQMIINQLMGIVGEPDESFVLDELSMSAACEVMNQMMGSAATAMSEFLGRTVNISTPTAAVMDQDNTFIKAMGLNEEDNIVSILFDMKIQDVMNTQFVSVFSCDFAKAVVSQFTGDAIMEEAPPVQVAPPAQSPQLAQPYAAQMPSAMAQPQMQQPQMQPPQMQQPQMQQPQMQQPQMQQPQMQQAPGMPQMQSPYPYPPYAAQGYPMYPYPPQGYPMQQAEMPTHPIINAQPVQFPEFGYGGEGSQALLGGNMKLIMNVPLNVEIVIGTTKRKIKDIMEYTQGTVIELDKQAGAPVDIMVNGQLLAHGDVVVIDDNFGVRVTEIVGTKELLNSLEKQAK